MTGFPASIELASLLLLLVGIGLAFSDIRLSGWVLGWILLSGALLVQWFRSILSYSSARGNVDPDIVEIADDWMGLGFALLIVASMYMMREVLARHSLTEQRLRVISAAARDAVVMMDNRGRIAFWNEAGQRIFGFSRQEAQGKKLHELIIPERNRMDFERNFTDFRRTGQGPVIGKTLELPGIRKDGAEIVTEVSVSGADVDEKWHAICIFRDITERKRAEQLLELEYAVARCLDGADNTAEALRAVIRAICQTQDWECGRFLRVDDAAGVLRLVEYWSVADGAIQGLLAASQGITYGPGVGMSGKVWQSGQPLWIADITKDARALTAIFKAESGVRGAFVFPVKVEGTTIGVFAFNSHEIREPDVQLLSAVRAIGSQVGGFLRRKRGEDA
ncbi:MAG: PAS domain S-box protein [Betaproteobacteria bacterium]|nr:PAS domain S-box protein [Betaproteobacteria bacterium]